MILIHKQPSVGYHPLFSFIIISLILMDLCIHMSRSCVTVQLVSIQLDGRFGRLYIFVSDESLLDDGLWRGKGGLCNMQHNFSVWVMRLFCKNLRHIHNNQLFGNNHHTMIDSTIYFWVALKRSFWCHKCQHKRSWCMNWLIKNRDMMYTLNTI